MPPRRKKQSSSSTEFPLLQALFGFPDAQPERPRPQESGPDAWVAQFITTAGSEVRQVLYKSCRAGRVLVLQQVPGAGAEVNAAAEQGEKALLERLSAVRDALLVRGTQPTTLCLTHDSEDSASLLSLLPSNLLHGGAGAGISSLIVLGGPTSEALTAFLQQATPHLPNLTSLTTFSTPSTIPPAAQLPKLRELSLELPDKGDLQPGQLDSLFTSIAQLLRQVTALSLIGEPDMDYAENNPAGLYPWPRLFSPTTTTHTLTELDISGVPVLEASTLGLLLDRTPQLKDLTINRLGPLAEGYREKVWGVERLWVMQECGMGLAGLPRPRQGRTKVWITEHFELWAETSQGMDAAFVARLGEWEFSDNLTVFLAPSYTLETDDHPAALRNALQQLTAFHAPEQPPTHPTTPSEQRHPVLKLVMWDWEQEGMAEVVSECMPELPMLNKNVKVRVNVMMSDGLLGAVLALGPHVHALSVEGLNLRTDAHVYEPWPWRVFECEGHVLNDAQLFRLPHPRSYEAGDGERPVLQLVVDWTPVVSKEDISRMKEWLKYIDVQSETADEGPSFTFNSPEYPDDLQHIKDQLALLAAIKYTKPAVQRSACIRLQSWFLDGPELSALSHIPRFDGMLDLTSCEWPLQAGKYERLGQLVRTGIRWWSLGEDVPEGVVKSIAAGINSYRKSGFVYWEGKGEVYLHVPAHQGPDKRVGSCVVITNRSPYDVHLFG